MTRPELLRLARSVGARVSFRLWPFPWRQEVTMTPEQLEQIIEHSAVRPFTRDALRWRALRDCFAGVDFGDRELAPLVALFKVPERVYEVKINAEGADELADAILVLGSSSTGGGDA